jgi:hypothetical protein
MDGPTMLGFPYRCPNCHQAQREGEPKYYKQGPYTVQMIKYTCGTVLKVYMDPPRYEKTIDIAKNCSHPNLDSDKQNK